MKLKAMSTNVHQYHNMLLFYCAVRRSFRHIQALRSVGCTTDDGMIRYDVFCFFFFWQTATTLIQAQFLGGPLRVGRQSRGFGKQECAENPM